MLLKIEYQTNGPYQSVEEALDNCECLELPTSQYYSKQENTTIEVARGVRIVINEHFGPVLWLSPLKDIPDFNPDVSVVVFINEDQLSFPKNFACCYGVGHKDTVEVTTTHQDIVTTNKFILTRL